MAVGKEISKGERFPFGANWKSFLVKLDEEHINEAVQSLKKMLDIDTLLGKRFLDVGSGSGLFSLAAKRLGAEVYSIDYDPQSVACTKELKIRYYNGDASWVVEEASALDTDYLASLGEFDIVYSWGVLHHTGDMEKALNNVLLPASNNTLLCIAIYNDQDNLSVLWKKVKQTYCSNIFGRYLILSIFVPFFFLQSMVIGLIKYKNPFKYFINYKKKRGMSVYHDWIDWLGGFPFEVAKPESIFKLYKSKGFILENLITTNRLGCNQYVFRKSA